jgi:c-di-GMP-binding flagellar brake protein YcgR
MLANAPVTFWRWLTGQPLALTPALVSEKPGEERRVWLRHAARMNVRCGEANDQTDGGAMGVIRDLSRGGVQIVAPRRFEPGTLLGVDFPATEDQGALTVLACVVRATPHGDSEWAMGCRFSGELSEDQLSVFGAARVRPAVPDPRGWERFSCDVKAFVQRVNGSDAAYRPARVLNIAVGGMALQVEEAVPVGELLNTDFHDATDQPIVTLLACVVHSQAVAEGHRLGCNFIRELTDAEIRVLV